jgi:hypothetical protein
MSTEVISAAHSGNHTIFLSGPPGSGKTTTAVRRLRFLLEQGVPAEQILILVPQRTLAEPYGQALHSVSVPPGGTVDIATIGGLARRGIDLFWPLLVGPAGFSLPERRPRFLTLETAQYYMERVAEPFLASGAFDGITISRARLVSQIIDNLNKAAAVGFPPEDMANRLKGAWGAESAQLRIYDQVQAVALAFRHACLAQNLLDWSLQLHVFWQHLLPLPEFRRYLLGGYRHLIVDNVEEDIPATHDLLRAWLPLCDSALVVFDLDGGYRVFLGADPDGALALRDLCRTSVTLAQSHVTSPDLVELGAALTASLGTDGQTVETGGDVRTALRFDTQRYHPQMLDWVADEVSRLVREERLPPGEIAILAPFLSDALRFSLNEKLAEYGIPVRTHRPSRQLREEPAARCLLTLARLAHPGWLRPPPRADVAQALALAIADMDPVRARLLADIVYRVRDGRPALAPFFEIVPESQTRISYLLGGRYDELWEWIRGYAERHDAGEGNPRLDHFLSRLFGEVLSQEGFGFRRNFDAGATAANLIESVLKFRQGLSALPGESDGGDLSLEYVDLVDRGVVAAQYVSTWQIHDENALLMVPAYTFLMMNRPVDVQFWLDAGSRAWFERIYQPLTHPYVLRRDWSPGRIWTDDDEVQVREQALSRLVLGLTRRCRQRVYLAVAELNEQGLEQQGPLLQAAHRMLRRQEGRAR